MRQKQIRGIVLIALIAGGSITGLVGCASSASAEEMNQLNDVNAEIASLQKKKSDLLDQEEMLNTSINDKKSRLQQIEQKLNEVNGVTKN